jgi:hypothetical protein
VFGTASNCRGDSRRLETDFLADGVWKQLQYPRVLEENRFNPREALVSSPLPFGNSAVAFLGFVPEPGSLLVRSPLRLGGVALGVGDLGNKRRLSLN